MFGRKKRRLGDLIRAERKRRGLQQGVLAKRLGITQAYLSELETGKKRPSFDLGVTICDALGISVSDLR